MHSTDGIVMSPNDANWPGGPAHRQAAEAPVFPGRGFSASTARYAVCYQMARSTSVAVVDLRPRGERGATGLGRSNLVSFVVDCRANCSVILDIAAIHAGGVEGEGYSAAAIDRNDAA
jgi:hypothetical protein